MIELIAARGNTSLESAVSLTKAIRHDIQSLARRLESAALAEELALSGALSARARAQNEFEIKSIILDIRKLLEKIEDAVPLMNLAITTSGARLSTTLPSTVSPSRLLQASTFLSACDTQYSLESHNAVQAGPTFTLSMYMLFSGHIRHFDEENVRETTWKEVIHKARVKLRRVPMDVFADPTEPRARTDLQGSLQADEFAYQILIVEDLDDDRVHEFEEGEAQPGPYEGIKLAGIREIIPVHQISKIFYADTGKMLNIGSEGETNNPVLLLKRDVNAIPPRRMIERNETMYGELDNEATEGEDNTERDVLQAQLDAQLNSAQPNVESSRYFESLSEHHIPTPWRLPPGLDPEWVAFEVYQEPEKDEQTSDVDDDDEKEDHSGKEDVSASMANLKLAGDKAPSSQEVSSSSHEVAPSTSFNPLFNNIRTSLSLLETLLRLTSLQQFQQQSHLSITDELLNFFLEESSSTGAGGDEQHRQRVRAEARRKVGWDPYDESPLKRRGENYQYQYNDDGHWTPTGTPGRYPYRDSSVDPISPAVAGEESYRSSRSSREQTPPLSSPGLPWQPSRQIHKPVGGKRGNMPKISPLSGRPTTAHTDEGLGTSPGIRQGFQTK